MEAAEEREIFFFVVSVETVQYPSCSSHRPVIVSLRFWSSVFHSFSLKRVIWELQTSAQNFTAIHSVIS